MRKVIFIFVLINCFVFSYSLPIWAKQKKRSVEERQSQIEKALLMVSAAQERVLEIGLVDCVVYALKGNSEILVKRIEPKLRQADIRQAKAIFEPNFFAGYSLRDNTALSAFPLFSGKEVEKSRDIGFSAGISGKLPWGKSTNWILLTKDIKVMSLLSQ